MNQDKLEKLRDAIDDYLIVCDFKDEAINSKKLLLATPSEDQKSVMTINIGTIDNAKRAIELLDYVEHEAELKVLYSLSDMYENLITRKSA